MEKILTPPANAVETTKSVEKTIVDDTETVEATKPETSGQDLRTKFETKLAELQAKLDAKDQAELDKNKTLEEKLASKEIEIKSLTDQAKKDKTINQIEKALVTSRIDNEFMDLMLSKASSEAGKEDFNLETTIASLKETYPKAFLSAEAKPMGKVGVSATTSTNTTKDIADMSVIEFAKYRLTQ